MRILEICTNFRPGGIQRHVLDLAAFLRDRGHEVTLAGDKGDWAVTGGGAGVVPVGLDAVAVTGGSGISRLLHLPAAAFALRRVISSRGIELIHAHETAPTLAAWLGSAGLGIPILMTYHGSAPDRVASVANIGHRCADVVVSPSRRSLDALVAAGLPAARTRHLGLGVAAFPPRDPADIATLRESLLAGRPGPLVLSLSRLDPQKGIDVMLRVAARVLDRHPGATFAVAGGGPLAGQVAGWAEAAGVGDAFRWLGPVEGVDRFLRAADLYLLTSRWEALPISIVEAFRAGLPVVATDCGGVGELVDDSVGALLPVGDDAAIAAEVSTLLGDPDLLRAKGQAALVRSAEPRFDPDAVHCGFEAFYREILAAR